MKKYLSKMFFEYLKSINYNDKNIIEVLKTKNDIFGDYTSNISLKIAKNLGEDPIKIANDIKIFIEKKYQNEIKKVTITKPGFINMFLKNTLIINKTMNFVKKEYKPNFGQIIKLLNINYEYVSANPTGDLHIGHARNAIIGSIVVNSLKYIGHNVFTEYYINDGGNQMKVLAESVYFYFAKMKNIKYSKKESEIGYHGPEIKEFAKQIVDQEQEIVGKNENERLENLEKISTNYFLNKIKDILIEIRLPKFDKWTSEKELLNNSSKMVLEDLKKRDVTYEKDGAIWIKTGKFSDEKDRVLVKNDGTFTYLVADISNHLDKYNRNFDLIIDLWGKDHHGYEPRVRASMEAFGQKIEKLKVDYISMVQIISDNNIVKMSKRSGNSLRIIDILKMIDKDIFRFFIASKNKEQEMKIDINEIVKKDVNNPFFYVQYANARINQLINNYKSSINKEIKFSKNYELLLTNGPSERKLMMKMIEFEDVMILVNNEREPSILLNYFKELAQIFNSYYSSIKIVDVNNKKLSFERISLVKALNNLNKTIFKILAIEPINEI